MPKDKYGNKSPVQIEDGEWWFNGCIIQRQNHPTLHKYVIFPESDISLEYVVVTATSFRDATESATDLGNLFSTNKRPADYLGRGQ